MSVYKTKVFARWAKGEHLTDQDLCRAVSEIEEGLIDAALGGSLVKKRVAASGRGKSGGYRTIIAYKIHRRAFFLYGFAKNERANIQPDELAALKKLAKVLIGYDKTQLAKALRDGVLSKVTCDEQD